MDFPKKIAIADQVNFYLIKTNKFNTASINIFIHRPLDSNAAKNTLIPLVLRRGTTTLNTLQKISLFLEELYGAGFDCGIAKKGERHIIRFHLEFINNEKIDGSIFDKSLKLMSEIILDPLLENGDFKHEYVAQEKENLKKIIEARVNNKMKYAIDRCIEEMCKSSWNYLLEHRKK